jgi:Ca-activated chloride channel family protein
MLAIDVSRSMCSTDIRPNRLQAAEAAALSFIERQQSTTQIGIVAFAGFAALLQPPTSDQEALEAAIEGLTPARWTAIGSGILESLDAIAEIDPNVAPSASDTAPQAQPAPTPSGVYAPHIIVLLTDGASNAGPLPLDAARQAVERGVRVYTIGFGTEDPIGSMMDCRERHQSNDSYGGGQQFGGSTQQFGGRFRRGIDETTLKQIAAMTGGEYYSATSASELEGVFANLPTYLSIKQETTEISVAFTAIGALLAGLAIVLALIWHPLP